MTPRCPLDRLAGVPGWLMVVLAVAVIVSASVGASVGAPGAVVLLLAAAALAVRPAAVLLDRRR